MSAPRRGSHYVRAAALAACVLLAGIARAGEEQELRDALKTTSRLTLQERPFAFLTDPSTPSAGVATMAYGFGLGSGVAADRPIPVNLPPRTGATRSRWATA